MYINLRTKGIKLNNDFYLCPMFSVPTNGGGYLKGDLGKMKVEETSRETLRDLRGTSMGY